MACTSPPNVLRAYYEQYQRDFSMFLKCHAKELVAGGGMVKEEEKSAVHKRKD